MSKCKTFSFTRDLVESVPNGLYLKSLVGDTLSIGVVKFVEAGSEGMPIKSHAHGEEASLQVFGGCTVYQGVSDGSTPRTSVELEAGRVMIMPADEHHYGRNRFDQAGVSLRINVATPPRADFGTKDNEKVFSHQAAALGGEPRK